MTIGQNIKTIRKQKGISQKELARLSELTVSGLQKIEYDEITPKANTIHKIAKVLGVEDIDLDDNLKEMIHRWNSQNNVEHISKEVQVFDSLPSYSEDDIEIFRQYLLLNPDGKQKVSEYIQDLTPKYQQK